MNKTQIINTVKLLLIIMLFSYVMDKLLYVTITKVSNTVFSGQSIGKLNHYLQIKDTTQTIVYGNSRANHHIDSKKISASSFNMGIDGKFIAYSATLIKLLPKNKEQLVILHIDPDVAFRPKYDRHEIKTLMVKYHQNETIKEELIRTEQNNVLQDFFWCLDYNGLLLGILKNAIFPKYDYKEYYGFDPLYTNETDKDIFKNILKIKDSITCREKVKLNDHYQMYLNEINSFCIKNKKKLIAVTSPIYLDKCLDDNKVMDSIFKEMKIPYIDYTNFFNSNNSINYWKDYAHLTNVAANKYTDVLNVAIKQQLKKE